MAKTELTVLVGAYAGASGADTALPYVKDYAADAKLKVKGAGIIRRWADDKVEIKDTGDWGFVKGAVAGGAATALLVALTGPIGVTVAGVGAVTGLAARLRDNNFNDNTMRKLGAGLKPDSSLLLIMAAPEAVEPLQQALTQSGAVVTSQGTDEETMNQLVAAYDEIRTKS